MATAVQNESIKWSAEETKFIHDEFSNFINRETELNMSTVRRRISERNILSGYSSQPKRVLDKIRYLKRNAKIVSTDNCSSIPEETFEEKLTRNGLNQVDIKVSIFFLWNKENNFVVSLPSYSRTLIIQTLRGLENLFK